MHFWNHWFTNQSRKQAFITDAEQVSVSVHNTFDEILPLTLKNNREEAVLQPCSVLPESCQVKKWFWGLFQC